MDEERTKTGLAALGITLALAAVLALAVVFGGRRAAPPEAVAQAPTRAVPASRERPPEPSHHPAKEAPLPHPECADALRWLRENLPEPGTLQVISWKRLDFAGDRTVPPGLVRLDAKFRAKNQLGGLGVRELSFFFQDGTFQKVHDFEHNRVHYP